MAHVKEPKGVDLEINSRDLTKEEESAISEFIKTFKASKQKSCISKRRVVKKSISKKVNLVKEK